LFAIHSCKNINNYLSSPLFLWLTLLDFTLLPFSSKVSISFLSFPFASFTVVIIFSIPFLLVPIPIFLNIVETNANVDNKGEKKDYSKYYPLDFSTVSNNQEKFDQLIVDRDGYFKNMKSVLSLKAIHSNEEIADAIYNVVRIDSDLSNLLVKIYDETKEDIKDDIYLADQIEKLEIVLYNMKDLRDKIVNAESEYSKHLEDIVKADAEQIQRVSKYSVLPLKSPINKMEKEIKNLKEDLEEALANQN